MTSLDSRIDRALGDSLAAIRRTAKDKREASQAEWAKTLFATGMSATLAAIGVDPVAYLGAVLASLSAVRWDQLRIAARDLDDLTEHEALNRTATVYFDPASRALVRSKSPLPLRRVVEGMPKRRGDLGYLENARIFEASVVVLSKVSWRGLIRSYQHNVLEREGTYDLIVSRDTILAAYEPRRKSVRFAEPQAEAS